MGMRMDLEAIYISAEEHAHILCMYIYIACIRVISATQIYTCTEFTAALIYLATWTVASCIG